MLTDYSTVLDQKECSEKCNSEYSCKFWDFGEGWCRLRTNSGNGPQSDTKYSSGAKHCTFELGNNIYWFINW